MPNNLSANILYVRPQLCVEHDVSATRIFRFEPSIPRIIAILREVPSVLNDKSVSYIRITSNEYHRTKMQTPATAINRTRRQTIQYVKITVKEKHKIPTVRFACVAVSPSKPAISDIAFIPMIPFMARFVWLARAPAKLSDENWFAGSKVLEAK